MNRRWQLSFDENSLLAFDMGWEGIKYAIIRELFAMILFAWLAENPDHLQR